MLGWDWTKGKRLYVEAKFPFLTKYFPRISRCTSRKGTSYLSPVTFNKSTIDILEKIEKTPSVMRVYQSNMTKSYLHIVHSRLNQRHSHCVKSGRIRSCSGPYSGQMWKNTDQNKSEYGHFSRREYLGPSQISIGNLKNN